MSRYSYLLWGLLLGVWWVLEVLGFAMDMAGPEAWTQWELRHWSSDWKTMPLQCAMLATIIVLFGRMRNRALKEDRREK